MEAKREFWVARSTNLDGEELFTTSLDEPKRYGSPPAALWMSPISENKPIEKQLCAHLPFDSIGSPIKVRLEVVE